MPFLRKFAVLSLACAGWAGPLAAHAGLGQAQALVNESADKFRQGDYLGALHLLQEAEPIVAEANDPALAQLRFNIARCLEELNRSREALSAYDAYLKVPDQAHRKERAMAAMAAIRKRTFGNIALTCEPVGAQVRMDKQSAVPCPFQLQDVEPGRYAFEISQPGYATVQQEVRVVAGTTATAHIQLPALGKALPPEAPPQEPSGGGGSVLPWVTMGAGVVLLGGGAFMTASALDDRDEAETLPPGDQRDERVDSFETNRTLSWVGYGLGGAAVAGGLVWLLTGRDSGTAAVVPTGNGALVRW